LKPDTLKELKKLTKQNDEKTNAAIEKYFSSKDEKKDSTKSSTKKSTKKTSNKKAEETKTSEEIGSPEENKEEAKREESKSEEKDDSSKDNKKDSLKIFDNKLLDVKANKDNIGFVFSKSKAEIAIDKAFED